MGAAPPGNPPPIGAMPPGIAIGAGGAVGTAAAPGAPGVVPPARGGSGVGHGSVCALAQVDCTATATM